MIKRVGAFILDTLQVLVFAIALFLFVYLLILQPHKIKGSSMEPNYHNGEFLLTDKLSYRFGDPQIGDVIVFKAPPDYKDEFIKRILAVPGDTVAVKDGHIVLNGTVLYEPYLTDEFPTTPGNFALEGKTITVPADSYFAVGDNRPHSYDSRAWGFVPRDKITGKAWILYWPISRIGTFEKVHYNL